MACGECESCDSRRDFEIGCFRTRGTGGHTLLYAIRERKPWVQRLQILNRSYKLPMLLSLLFLSVRWLRIHARGFVLLSNRLESDLPVEAQEAARLEGMYAFQNDIAHGGLVVGLDEVGRGPLAGPLAVGASGAAGSAAYPRSQ